MALYGVKEYRNTIGDYQGMKRIRLDITLINSSGNEDKRTYIISSDTRNPQLNTIFSTLEYGLSEAYRLKDKIKLSHEKGSPYVQFGMYTTDSSKREIFRWTAFKES